MTIGIHKKQKQIQGGKIPSYLFFFTHNLLDHHTHAIINTQKIRTDKKRNTRGYSI